MRARALKCIGLGIGAAQVHDAAFSALLQVRLHMFAGQIDFEGKLQRELKYKNLN